MTIYSSDLYFSHLIQKINFVPLKAYILFISTIGNFFPLFIILLLLTLYINKSGHKKASVYLFLSTSIGVLISTFLKIIIARPRPTSDLVDVVVKLKDFSFPSGHCVSFTVLFGFLYYYLTIYYKDNSYSKLIRLLLLVLIASVGFSRIYLGAHWLTDCLSGYLLGAVILFTTIKLFKNER